jgi:hypothetical protein
MDLLGYNQDRWTQKAERRITEQDTLEKEKFLYEEFADHYEYQQGLGTF